MTVVSKLLRRSLSPNFTCFASAVESLPPPAPWLRQCAHRLVAFAERPMADDGRPDLSCFDFVNRGGEQESREVVLKKDVLQEEEQLRGQMSQAAAADMLVGQPAADVQTSQPAAISSSHSSDEDRPLRQRQAAAEAQSEKACSSEEDRPLCKRHVRRPAAEVPESSDEDRPLSQLKRARRVSPSASEEDKPLAQRAGLTTAMQAAAGQTAAMQTAAVQAAAVQATAGLTAAVEAAAVQAARPRVETARLVALGMPAERAAGVARFSSSLPPHTRTGFELAYACAAALERPAPLGVGL